MTGERKFVRENTNRILIKEFLCKEIKGAGLVEWLFNVHQWAQESISW